MLWYLPSWNGDIRFEPEGDRTKLVIFEPTLGEQDALKALAATFAKKKWQLLRRASAKARLVKYEGPLWMPGAKPESAEAVRQELVVDAPLAKAAPVVVKALKGGKQTLSALVLKDGKIETVSGADAASDAALGELAAKAEKKGEKAATVKRPTPCCPDCIPGSIEPASEVLLSFLDERQHADWARHRAIAVEGGTTGHRYLLAHRHSRIARKNEKICYDLDDEAILHFHDWSVPPEEEVLAAKLVLEHREAWLRNKATCLDCQTDVLDNPFGGWDDGMTDATLTNAVGEAVGILLPLLGCDPQAARPSADPQPSCFHAARWRSEFRELACMHANAAAEVCGTLVGRAERQGINPSDLMHVAQDFFDGNADADEFADAASTVAVRVFGGRA